MYTTQNSRLRCAPRLFAAALQKHLSHIHYTYTYSCTGQAEYKTTYKTTYKTIIQDDIQDMCVCSVYEAFHPGSNTYIRTSMMYDAIMCIHQRMPSIDYVYISVCIRFGTMYIQCKAFKHTSFCYVMFTFCTSRHRAYASIPSTVLQRTHTHTCTENSIAPWSVRQHP